MRKILRAVGYDEETVARVQSLTTIGAITARKMTIRSSLGRGRSTWSTAWMKGR